MQRRREQVLEQKLLRTIQSPLLPDMIVHAAVASRCLEIWQQAKQTKIGCVAAGFMRAALRRLALLMLQSSYADHVFISVRPGAL